MSMSVADIILECIMAQRIIILSAESELRAAARGQCSDTLRAPRAAANTRGLPSPLMPDNPGEAGTIFEGSLSGSHIRRTVFSKKSVEVL